TQTVLVGVVLPCAFDGADRRRTPRQDPQGDGKHRDASRLEDRTCRGDAQTRGGAVDVGLTGVGLDGTVLQLDAMRPDPQYLADPDDALDPPQRLELGVA